MGSQLASVTSPLFRRASRRVSPHLSRSRPPHFLGKMYVAVRRRFTLKWRGGCPDIVGRATRLLLYPSVSAAQGILPGGCASELCALMPGLACCSLSHWGLCLKKAF